MDEEIRFTLNGTPRKIAVDGDRALLWVLRTDLGLTGTKYGCGGENPLGHYRKRRYPLLGLSCLFRWRTQGRGITCGINAGTYVATIAEVEVDKCSGVVSVNR